MRSEKLGQVAGLELGKLVLVLLLMMDQGLRLDRRS